MLNKSTSLSCKHPLPVLLIPCIRTDKKGVTKKSHNVIFLKRDNYLNYINNPNFSWLPCGQCIACRLKHSYEWASRLMLEAENSQDNYFITLTYDDDHIKMITTDVVHRSTGEIVDNCLTLRKKHFQDFMKRLREHFRYYGLSDKIRFYACGEYGSTTYRPHYHAILYNVPFNDLELFKPGKMPYYISPTLAQLWPFGYHIICPVNFDTCAYVGGYVTKKYNGLMKKFEDECIGQEPEFSIMSRRPGIARYYFDHHKDDIYKFDEIMLNKGSNSAVGGVRKVKPSKYFDKLFDISDPTTFALVKANRKVFAVNSSKQKEQLTNLAHFEVLEAEERQLLNRQKSKNKIL